MRDPRDARKTREQLSLNTFEVVDVQKGSKVISSPTSSYYVIGKIGSIPLNDSDFRKKIMSIGFGRIGSIASSIEITNL